MSTILILFFILNTDILATESNLRQKRCIVIQKQSGSHGDSSEAEEDYRRPQPKDLRADRLRRLENKKQEFEMIPELLNYKTMPGKKINEKFNFNKLFKNVFGV